VKSSKTCSLPVSIRRVVAAIGLMILVASLPACQGEWRNRPYSAARPTYNQPNLNPMRIGGYAGYNYGPGARVVPQAAPVVVRPAEEPSLIP
jgi:hypothetical protein